MRHEKKKLKRTEMELFHQQMATILDLEFPLPQGVRRFAGDIRNPKFRETLYRLSSRLEIGESLSEAMKDDKHFFTPDYVAMIRIGEQGGNLRDTLNMVVEYERLQRDFREKVKSALTYPLTVFIFVCAVYLFAILYTYPVFMDCFQMTETGMPLMVDAWGKIVVITARYGPIFGLLFIVALFVPRGHRFKRQIHGLLLKTPLFGRILKEKFIVSFSEGLAILLGNGVPVPESMRLLAGITDNKSIASRLEKAENSAREGADLELLLTDMEIFPDLYRSAVYTGTRTGTLNDTLFRLSGIYKSQMEYHANLFLRVLEISFLLLIGVWITIFGISFFSMYTNLLNIIDYTVKW